MKKTLLHFLLAIFALFGCSRAWSVSSDRTALLKFSHSPFPLKENISELNVPFFDVLEEGRRGHTSVRGGIYWENETYIDDRVLLSLSPNFDPRQQPLIIVYLHGNQSLLERDVMGKHYLPVQMGNAEINALFVAPQFALDALDSSAGRFTQYNFFAKFMQETAQKVAEWQRNKSLKSTLEKAPIVLVAYSGGYVPASFILERGGVDKRIMGVVLLDALYSDEIKFSNWIQVQPNKHFFFSAYTLSSRIYNENLKAELRKNCIPFKEGIPDFLARGQIGFLDMGDDLNHYDLPIRAWVDEPFTELMVRIKYRHQLAAPNKEQRKAAQQEFNACRKNL